MATRNRGGSLDQMALKFNQGSIITLLVLAFILNGVWLVAFVGAVMLIGTIWPNAGLFKLIYQNFVKPMGLLKPELRADRAQPHLFAQGLGGIFLALATISFALGAALLGWLLTAMVVVLAAINLVAGFCLGCFIYYQLARRGVNLNLPMWRTVE
ncbi:MAG: DUF4395 domain-containing protein [Caldilineaceae bacterium]|nr:DUF4395 domain-containing protein [Caldilineaceae bacterium]